MIIFSRKYCAILTESLLSALCKLVLHGTVTSTVFSQHSGSPHLCECIGRTLFLSRRKLGKSDRCSFPNPISFLSLGWCVTALKSSCRTIICGFVDGSISKLVYQ